MIPALVGTPTAELAILIREKVAVFQVHSQLSTRQPAPNGSTFQSKKELGIAKIGEGVRGAT